MLMASGQSKTGPQYGCAHVSETQVKRARDGTRVIAVKRSRIVACTKYHVPLTLVNGQRERKCAMVEPR